MKVNDTDKSTWQTVRFGDMAQHIGERVQPDDATVDRYVGLEHLDPESLKIRRWGSPDDVGATKLRFYPGDIIFGKRRFYQRKLAVADFEGICSAHAMVLRAKPDIILPEFLPFFMQGETFFERAISISVGSLSPTINWSTLQRQEFTLPPLDEQRRIAEVLMAVEESLEKWVAAISCTKKAKDRLAYELFKFSEIRKEEPNIPEGYTIGTLENLAEINPSKPRNLLDNLRVSFIGMADVSDEGGIEQQEVKKLSEVKTGYTYFQEGDVLFAKITPCMENGKGAIARHLENSIGFGSTEFHVLRATKSTDVDFVYQLTMNSYFRLRAEAFMAGTAGQKRVRNDFLEKLFHFLIPPAEKRQEIGKHLSSFDAIMNEQKLHASKLREMKQTLLSELLR